MDRREVEKQREALRVDSRDSLDVNIYNIYI